MIKEVRATAYTIPTDQPEADGTLAWQETTLVLVEITAVSGKTGIGYTYAHPLAAVHAISSGCCGLAGSGI